MHKSNLFKSAQSNVWLIFLIVSLLFSFSVGLFLIWMSIDRNSLAHNIHQLQQELTSSEGHIIKLEVERDSYLSPYILDQKAQAIGLKIADPGQVRRLH